MRSDNIRFSDRRAYQAALRSLLSTFAQSFIPEVMLDKFVEAKPFISTLRVKLVGVICFQVHDDRTSHGLSNPRIISKLILVGPWTMWNIG